MVAALAAIQQTARGEKRTSRGQPHHPGNSMKTNLTQWRIKSRKASACGLCKPWKQGWMKTVRDIRHAQRAQQQLAEISRWRLPSVSKYGAGKFGLCFRFV
jgi:hypothetical protein